MYFIAWQRKDGRHDLTERYSDYSSVAHNLWIT